MRTQELIVEIGTYPDEAVVKMKADEAGGDASVLGEGRSNGLPDKRLGVGAGLLVEPHPELRGGQNRQQAHGGERRDEG